MRRPWGAALALSSVLTQSTVCLGAYSKVCAQIAASVSATPSAVYYAGDEGFDRLSKHWASSSDQVPACVVEPRTTDDVGKTLQIVGKTSTPFAVMGGGHMMSRFISSTTGVHISTAAFTSIEYDETAELVTFGAGLKWDEVYNALEPHGVNVAGGRVPGVGVGGPILGGGYSLHTNQFGLTLDSVEAFELVKPCGKVVEVMHQSDPELFFALKGSGNNFGIVTKFTMKTFPQGRVWGGTITYTDPNVFPAVNAAVAKFSAEATDPKAVLGSGATMYQGTPSIQVRVFYDAPEPPAGIFDAFMNISAASSTVVASQSFASMISSITFTSELAGVRAYSLGVSVPAYSLNFLDVVNDQVFSQNADLANKSLFFLLTSELFLPTILSHSKHDTAYPFTRDEVYTPFNIFVAWTDPAYDESIKKDIERISDRLVATLVAEGYTEVPTLPLYPNYSLWDAPLDRIYGINLHRLQVVKRRVDPEDVMGLSGGFKIPPR